MVLEQNVLLIFRTYLYPITDNKVTVIKMAIIRNKPEKSFFLANLISINLVLQSWSIMNDPLVVYVIV